MTTENQKVFLFSPESANSFGYNIGLKKDGSTITYTAICSHEDEYNWLDKRTVYKGKTEDFLEIKNFDYQNGNLEIDKSGSMGEKPKELNFDYSKGGKDLTKPLVDIDKIAGEFKKVENLIMFSDLEPDLSKPLVDINKLDEAFQNIENIKMVTNNDSQSSKPLVDVNKIAGEFKKINKLLNNNDSESGEKKPKIK